MGTFDSEPQSHIVDLCKYAERIASADDRPLFEDAAKAARVGALRAAYLIIWLACAESLKRRFREAQIRDNTAGVIVGDFEKMENDQRAVDKFLLDKARDYGFLSPTDHAQLIQVYDNRCVYGHPYEKAPSPEKTADAAQTVVELVLSKPVRLRHGYCDKLLADMLGDKNYLDDQATAVAAFAQVIVPKIDENIYGWLLDRYWGKLETIADDASMTVFFRRGIWFTKSVLEEIGVPVFTVDEWHERTAKFPDTLSGVCSTGPIFKHIGMEAQNSLVGHVLDRSETKASVLSYVQRLDDAGALSERQHQRFVERVAKMPIADINASGLSTNVCYDKLIRSLKAHNWYAQNPAVDLLVSNGPEQAAELTVDQQVELGRNILQSAEGYSGSAVGFLERELGEGNGWPPDLVRGIALETFANERNEARLKVQCLQYVLLALQRCSCDQRRNIIANVVQTIKGCTSFKPTRPDTFEATIGQMNAKPWAEPLVEILRENAGELTISP